MNKKVVLKYQAWWSCREITDLLGYHPVHVRRIIGKKKLPSTKFSNGARRVAFKDLVRWITDHGLGTTLVLDDSVFAESDVVSLDSLF